jgi:rare lipoprotein A (peptidoglycan hydrolase)
VKCTGATNLALNPSTSSSVIVRVVDTCPKCSSTINLSRDAFSRIADPNAGKVKILIKFYVPPFYFSLFYDCEGKLQH